MITDITKQVLAEEKACQVRVSQAYLQGLWAVAETMARNGFELPTPMFQLNRYRRSIHLRYNGVIVLLSLGRSLSGWPDFQVISGSGRTRYFPPPPVDQGFDDQTFINYVKRCIDDIPKQQRATMMKNADTRWRTINNNYQLEGADNQQ
ncbi:MAG: hypothetical protein EBU46_11190 [Nitrosomonadaceae bacterium]|nr:hypothetical protein [Nitrosomonadaceae bacterium]